MLFQQVLPENLTLPSLACLLPIMHPGARFPRQIMHMHAEQGAWKHNSSDQAAFFHCSMVQSWCSCSHCHFEWCTGFSIGTLSGLQLAYTANWLFWHLSIRTNFFLAIWATVARLLDWTTREHRQSSLPMCITEHVALSVVQHCSTADRKQFCQSSSNHDLSFVKLV